MVVMIVMVVLLLLLLLPAADSPPSDTPMHKARSNKCNFPNEPLAV